MGERRSNLRLRRSFRLVTGQRAEVQCLKQRNQIREFWQRGARAALADKGNMVVCRRRLIGETVAQRPERRRDEASN